MMKKEIKPPETRSGEIKVSMTRMKAKKIRRKRVIAFSVGISALHRPG